MLQYVKSYAHREDDSPDLAFQKQLLAIISSFLIICGSVWIVMFISVFGWTMPAHMAALFTVNAVVMFIISHRLKNHLLLVYPIFYAATITTVIAQWSIGSMHDGGMVFVWGFLTPLGILIFTSLRPAIIAMLIFISCILITVIFEPLLPPPLHATEEMIKMMHSMNLVVSFSVIFITCAWFVRTIREEKRTSEELLLNILPRDVAEELEMTGETKAKAFTMVTVMFTDFVGFAQVSKRVSAELLVDEIHHCFSAFDRIIQKYRIEKIKTIGDAYLCASGLPISNYTHAVDMVNAAFEMRDFMLKRKAEKEAKGEIPFELRIGVHTGPVVAGIVGVRKFQYDIWGDTVNTANRVENSCKAGKVNISQSTFELIKDNPKFVFEGRGKIEVKGKGELEMYFVEHANEEALKS